MKTHQALVPELLPGVLLILHTLNVSPDFLLIKMINNNTLLHSLQKMLAHQLGCLVSFTGPSMGWQVDLNIVNQSELMSTNKNTAPAV